MFWLIHGINENKNADRIIRTIIWGAFKEIELKFVR